jgi:hypothetical protein
VLAKLAPATTTTVTMAGSNALRGTFGSLISSSMSANERGNSTTEGPRERLRRS